MTKLIQAYVEPGVLKWVRLDRDIIALDDKKLNMDTAKLRTKLDKERAKNSKVVGIIDGKVCMITLYDNNKFSGVVWAGNRRLSGNYVLA